MGQELGSLDPTPSKARKLVSGAGLNVGGTLTDAGQNLAPNINKLGQMVAQNGAIAGGKLLATGQGIDKAATVLAPRLAQVGKVAAQTSEVLAGDTTTVKLSANGFWPARSAVSPRSERRTQATVHLGRRWGAEPQPSGALMR